MSHDRPKQKKYAFCTQNILFNTVNQYIINNKINKLCTSDFYMKKHFIHPICINSARKVM